MQNLQLHSLAKILHTIFCDVEHSEDMKDTLGSTSKCVFYLEDNIEDTWEQPSHRHWLQQAFAFNELARPIGVNEAVQNIIGVYRVYMAFMKADPRLAKYIRILLEKGVVR